jgi:hypothetical protein
MPPWLNVSRLFGFAGTCGSCSQTGGKEAARVYTAPVTGPLIAPGAPGTVTQAGAEPNCYSSHVTQRLLLPQNTSKTLHYPQNYPAKPVRHRVAPSDDQILTQAMQLPAVRLVKVS